MEELESTLKLYRSQLLQVESLISNDRGNQDLSQLRSDMIELISLTEQSLLSYKKSKLLSNVREQNEELSKKTESSSDGGGSGAMLDDEMSKFYSELEENETNKTNFSVESEKSNKEKKITNHDVDELNEEFLDIIENCDDISGCKCQAPLTTEWSGTTYHNAMIMNVVCKKDDDIHIKVLFLNPMNESMKFCPYLLDDKCRFSDDSCKYSHGFVVSLYKLRKFMEPDFDNFDVGSPCLVKHDDGLWSMAEVESCHRNHQYSVRFLHKHLVCDVDVTDVMPIHNHHTNNTYQSHDGDVITPDDSTKAEVSNIVDGVGMWERHTRGIGSKIMMKLGYIPGSGLGRDGSGRVEPVPVVVLPPGKSLDHCMNAKEKKQKSTNEQKRICEHRNYKPPTVFHFLNKTLGDDKQMPKPSAISGILTKDLFGIKREFNSEQKKLGSKLLKNDSKIKELNSRVKKLRESVARNKNKNPKVACQLNEKLSKALNELQAIQSSSRVIEAHQSRNDTHRKMTKF